MSRRYASTLLLVLLMTLRSVYAVDYPSLIQPGQAKAVVQDDTVTLQNDVLRLTLSQRGRRLRLSGFYNIETGHAVADSESEFFHITAGPDSRIVACSQFLAQGSCDISRIPAAAGERTLSHRFPGVRIRATLVSPDQTFTVDWALELRDGSNYVRQFVTLAPREGSIRIASIRFCDMNVEGAHVAGTVPGSPVVTDDGFIAYEHPNARNSIEPQLAGPDHRRDADAPQRVLCTLDRETVLRQGQSLTQSAVMGVVPAGQLRRGFLHYLERERAAPYHGFLHYNSWYDIAWSGREKMNSGECVAVIERFGDELITRRGVDMDCLVFDDGWDDPKTLWQVLEKNFPEGFTPLQRTAETFDTNIGVWLSPWGGYGQAKADRLAYGKTQGFEIGPAGFSLAGEKYFRRFRQSCVDFVERYHVNFFKFDGTDAKLLAETEALLRLCGDLYERTNDMTISLTVGTWASPFWLLHADSVWRGGQDMGFYGPGTQREQWLTYRDKITHQNMVKGGPLYPLNAFMNQGIAHAVWGTAHLPTEPEAFAHEVYSFFAIGTGLQELYVAPSRMTDRMWDILAEGARWSRDNARTLVDTHWIGGDPNQLQIYGCASWRDNEAIVMLRNPADRDQAITLNLADALELPPYARTTYTFKSPWRADAHAAALTLDAAVPHTFKLAAFDVLVLESIGSR